MAMKKNISTRLRRGKSMLRNLIAKNRTYRRFDENVTISRAELEDLIDYARLSASGGNKQPLKYILSYEKEMNERIYSTLVWAAYLADWPGPDAGERPTAYIIIVEDKEVGMAGGVDHGIAAQSIMLGAVEKGLGGCMIAGIQRPKLRDLLHLPERFEILLALALGKPKETVVIEEIGPDADIKYWRDEHKVHHVPKRKLKDIILRV
jgi:nitroreductase